MNGWKLLSVSMAALALAACESGEEKASRFTENAQDYLAEGQLQRARIQFHNALENDPANVEALRGAAEVAELQERLTDQLRYLERLVTIEPDNIEAIAKISRLNLLGGRPDEALNRADQVLEAQPANLEALTVKGAVLVLKNDLDGASEALEQALAQAPDNAEVRNLLAARYVRDEEFDRAQSVIDEGLAADPQNEALLVVKLLLAQRRQDANGMGETFQSLIETSPENGFYRERYGEFLLLARRDLAGAKEQFFSSIPLLEDKSAAIGRYVAIVREESGNEAAEAELREVVGTYPEDADLAFAIPAFLCEIGDTERCEAELQTIANDEEAEQSQRALATVQLGERAFSDEDRDGAMAFAEQVLAEDEENPDALTLKGKVQLAQDDVQGAIETLRLALNAERYKESAMILIGLAYEADGRQSFAEQQLTLAIAENGLSPVLFQTYRGMLARAGKSEEAAELTLRFAQTPDATPEVQLESAAVLLAQGRDEEAEVVSRSLIRSNPDNQPARRVLATTLFRQDRFAEALDALDNLSEEGADNLAAMQLRNQVLQELGREDDARAFLQQVASNADNISEASLLVQFEADAENLPAAQAAAEAALVRFPDSEQAHVLVYNTLNSQGQSAAAMAALDRGIASIENTANLRLLKSNQLLQEGDREGARDVLLTLYEDEALNDLSANNLAALMLDFGGDPAVALEIARRFEGTEQPFLADTLAWALYKNGENEEAMRYSNIAADAGTVNAEILYHRGVIAAANGDLDTARQALEDALDAPGKTETVSEEAINQALADL